MKRGTFIVVEGGGGSGKSTLLAAAREAYSEDAVLFTREPGGTPFAEAARALLFDPITKDVSPDATMQLVEAARIDHLKRLIAPTLAKGIHVLCDRFDSSTYAYQVTADGGSHLKEWFWHFRNFYKDTHPDLYIFLDVDPKKAIERARARNNSGAKVGNYFDEKEVAYHQKVYDGYREFFRSVPHAIIDASKPLEEVRADFLSTLAKILK